MKLYDLIHAYDWDEVWATGVFINEYSEEKEVEELYTHIYQYLKSIELVDSKEATKTIYIEKYYDKILHEDINDIYGVIENNDSEELCVRHILEFEDWSSWLGMNISEKTRKKLTGQQIVAHCLYEMTFHGWLPGEQKAIGEQYERIGNLAMRNLRNKEYDAFISYASEDKPLVEAVVYYLENEGYKVWFDDLELKVGDSLRQELDRGLQKAKFGIVVLSNKFFEKNWTQYELDGLVAKQMEGAKVILPIWHNITKNDVLNFSPTLADKIAIKTDKHPRTIAFRLAEAMEGGEYKLEPLLSK